MAELLTTAQVAELCGVTPRTIRNWESSGKLEAVDRTKGGHRRFTCAEVRKKIIENTRPQDGVSY